MKKGNISSAPVKKVKKDYFTGPVTLREISGITKPSEHDIYHVIFKKSARTKIHSHTGAQMLIVTKGKGSLVYYKKTSGEKMLVQRLFGMNQISDQMLHLKYLEMFMKFFLRMLTR